MKEEWLFHGALVPIDAATTAALVAEIKRLIDVVGGMALAQPELVGWQYREANDDGTWRAWLGCDKRLAEDHWRQVRAIYTAPPKRPWVGLPEDEIEYWIGCNTSKPALVRAISKALKEKNT